MQKKESTMGNVKDLFIQYMSRVRILYLEEAEKKLSTVEIEELYDLRNLLFESIKRYGFSLVHERMGKRGIRNVHKDVTTEMGGVLFIVFCERLGKYNTAFSPTTYFKWWFYGGISQYIAKEIGIPYHTTQKIEKLEKARQKYEKAGLPYTIEMLAEDVGAKEETVRNDLLVERRIQRVDFDRIYSVRDERLTPEEIVIEKERQEELQKLVRGCLSELEYQFFYKLFYVDAIESISYRKMARSTGYRQKTAKEIWLSIVDKIKSNIRGQ